MLITQVPLTPEKPRQPLTTLGSSLITRSPLHQWSSSGAHVLYHCLFTPPIFSIQDHVVLQVTPHDVYSSKSHDVFMAERRNPTMFFNGPTLGATMQRRAEEDLPGYRESVRLNPLITVVRRLLIKKIPNFHQYSIPKVPVRFNPHIFSQWLLPDSNSYSRPK